MSPAHGQVRPREGAGASALLPHQLNVLHQRNPPPPTPLLLPFPSVTHMHHTPAPFPHLNLVWATNINHPQHDLH